MQSNEIYVLPVVRPSFVLVPMRHLRYEKLVPDMLAVDSSQLDIAMQYYLNMLVVVRP